MSTSPGKDPGEAKVAAEAPSNATAAAPSPPANRNNSRNNSTSNSKPNNNANNNRQRRRSNANAKGDGDTRTSRSGSGSRVSESRKDVPRNGRKDWSERKSMSQGGAGSSGVGNRGNNKHHRDQRGQGDAPHKRAASTNSTSEKNRHQSTRTNSQTSNGDGYCCSDEFDLDEPFSDSDDEGFRSRQPQKMVLPVPRGRIRTLSGTVPVVGYSPKWGGPTMCLSCLQFFDLPDQIGQFASHLLKEHKIVVSEMAAIVDPKRYIEHWRQRFAKESVDKVFPRIDPTEGMEFFGETDYYYYLSEALPEDYSLRQRLAMRRLEEALQCQQRERDDLSFEQQCIFCRYKARGNRSKIIHHLYMIHHLNLGSPDNLVFVTEYIEHLKEKLQRNECIYCEKIFQDRNTLMDHMRKRNHREVNPKNHYYDKFYIINYLELGKRWLDVLAEDFEDTMPTFQDSDEEEEDNSWCEWQEDNVDVDETRVMCLMCDETDETASGLLDHMKVKHDFDLLHIIEKDKLDTYDRMKLVNYIRKMTFNGKCWLCQKSELGNPISVMKHIEETEKSVKDLPDKAIWNTEENIVPQFGNDHFLWMLESYLDQLANPSSGEEDPAVDDLKERLARLIKESQKNTVEGVVAEDLPELTELDEADLQELRG